MRFFKNGLFFPRRYAIIYHKGKGENRVDCRYIFDLRRILNYIEKHLHDNISVEDISINAGYSYWYCNRLFRSLFGESLAAYLYRLRMEAAKEELKEFRSVKLVAESLSYRSPEGFSRAFQKYYGITPSAFLCGEKLKETYVKTYEYRDTPETWGKGDNPTADGLWEFGYYDTVNKSYALMEWDAKEEYFIAPFDSPDIDDPYWYCQNRWEGFGMHPGKTAQAVRTFLCPHSGSLDFLFSVGRFLKLLPKRTPCTVQIFRNNTPIAPTEEPMILKDVNSVFLTGTCQVRRGDRISLHLGSLGNISHQGLIIYRSRFGYKSISDPSDRE